MHTHSLSRSPPPPPPLTPLLPLLLGLMFDCVAAAQMNQHKAPSRAVDSRAISRGPDFTPAFADFGRQMSGGRGAAVSDVQQPATSNEHTHTQTHYQPQEVNGSPFILMTVDLAVSY